MSGNIHARLDAIGRIGEIVSKSTVQIQTIQLFDISH